MERRKIYIMKRGGYFPEFGGELAPDDLRPVLFIPSENQRVKGFDTVKAGIMLQKPVADLADGGIE